MAKKIAGEERPYTFREFTNLVEAIAKERKVPYLDQLDYICSEWDEYKIMDDPYAEITPITHWGGSEGIYTTLNIRNYLGEDIRICTCKTLGEGDSDYIAMCTMAGHLCVIANRYIKKHPDEFNWKGYDIDYTTKDGLKGGYCQMTFERAHERARELASEGCTGTIRNNETRTIEKF